MQQKESIKAKDVFRRVFDCSIFKKSINNTFVVIFLI